MREDAPHFEKMREDDLFFVFFCFGEILFTSFPRRKTSFLLYVQIRPEKAKIEESTTSQARREKLSSADLFLFLPILAIAWVLGG